VEPGRCGARRAGAATRCPGGARLPGSVWRHQGQPPAPRCRAGSAAGRKPGAPSPHGRQENYTPFPRGEQRARPSTSELVMLSGSASRPAGQVERSEASRPQKLTPHCSEQPHHLNSLDTRALQARQAPALTLRPYPRARRGAAGPGWQRHRGRGPGRGRWPRRCGSRCGRRAGAGGG